MTHTKDCRAQHREYWVKSLKEVIDRMLEAEDVVVLLNYIILLSEERKKL